jgi:undecaprenyl-diphosphatase
LPSFFSQLVVLDKRASYALRVAQKPGFDRTAALLFAHSGDSWFWGAGLLILWALGTEAWKTWAVWQLAFIIGLAALVLVLKFSIKRKRPEGEWGQIYRNTDPHSFPSGHAARAFLIACLAVLMGPAWLAIILLVWAPLVTLSRVLMGVHYLSDVLAGAIVGVFFAILGWGFVPLISLPPFLLSGF